MRQLLILLLSIYSGLLTGQPVITFYNALPPDQPVELRQGLWYMDDVSGDMLPLDSISRKQFGPYVSGNFAGVSSKNLMNVAWFRFRLHNAHPTNSLPGVIYCGRHMRVMVVEQRAGHVFSPKQGGYLTTFNPRYMLTDRYGLTFTLPAGQTHLYWVQVSDYFNTNDRFQLQLFSPQGYRLAWTKQTQQAVPSLVFFSAVLGCLLFMSLFSLAQYIINKDKAYVWYAAYLVGTTFVGATGLWLWRGADLWPDIQIWVPNQKVYFASLLILGDAIQLSYLFFLSYLLNVSSLQPRLWRWLRYYLLYKLIPIVLFVVESMSGGFGAYGFAFHFVVNLINLGSLLLLLLGMLRSPHPLRPYATTGSALLLAGFIATVYLTLSNFESTSQLHGVPIFYFSVGIVLEILCFSLALGRRSYLHEAAKNHIQYQFIQQLEKNQHLQQNYSMELEQQLSERTREIEAQSRILEQQHILQLQAGFEHKQAETEMAALRAQMNPHFIFNCLNSIKRYATDNEAVKATEYLSKFAKLIRLVLENSRSNKVTLSNELAALQLYLELEAMRFKNKLSYQIDIDDSIDVDFIEIPPLLIQPYVENAIWHGLMQKEEGGRVWIRVEQPQENRLKVTVKDNGVGRAKAAELKSKSSTQHKSFGMQITSDRIELINQLYQTQTQVQIEDLLDASGEPVGTKVILEILT